MSLRKKQSGSSKKLSVDTLKGKKKKVELKKNEINF